MHIKRKLAVVASVFLTTISLSGCSYSIEDPADSAELIVVTHDSAVFTDEVLAEFKAETGIVVKQLKAGDAGEMTNKLVLTKESPIGDVVFGIDTTFSSVAIENGIVAGELSAIDFGDVCFNYDKQWFSLNEQAPPSSIQDLTKPAFKGLTVVTNPNTSSPGLSFLAATVSVFGELGWQQYWQALQSNDVKVAAGWEDAYFTEFSGSSGKGKYPIVLSYSSSPAFEIRENGESQTESLLDGCFRQTEYAGVLKNAKNLAGAKKFVEFLQRPTFQETLAETMYVYPILTTVKLPAEWSEFAPVATNPVGGELDISANRKDWLKKWSEIFNN